MYLLVSSTTMPEPLSACLMTIVRSFDNELRACISCLLRLG